MATGRPWQQRCAIGKWTAFSSTNHPNAQIISLLNQTLLKALFKFLNYKIDKATIKTKRHTNMQKFRIFHILGHKHQYVTKACDERLSK